MTDENALAVRPPAKLGRPTTYTPERGEQLCRAMESGLTFRQMRRINRRRPGTWISPESVYDWAEAHEEFRQRLARARKARAADLSERPLELLEAVNPDSEFGGHRISKARSQAEHMRWLAGALDPETFRENKAVTVNVGTQIDLGAILPPRATQPDREVT